MFTRLIYNASNLLRGLGFDFHEEQNERIMNMHATLRRLGGVNFKIEVAPNGEWVAESTNVNGIITGGRGYPHDVSEKIRDAVFTYFEIPPHLCKQSLIRQEGEVLRVEERVYA